MAKAAQRSTTNPAREPTKTVTPVSCEFTPGNLVKVTLETKNGDLDHATMSATALVNLVSMAVQLVNKNLEEVLKEVVASDAEQVAAAT